MNFLVIYAIHSVIEAKFRKTILSIDMKLYKVKSSSNAVTINADFIKHCYFDRIDTDLVSKVIFLLELLFIRDGSFVLPGNGLSSVELSACIRHVCREV
jgi:hypothetical protein